MSVAYSPLRRRRTKSFGSSTRRTRRQASGSCVRTHSSFVSVKLVSAGFDVSSSRRVAPIVSVEPAALGLGALIAPDDRRPHDRARVIQQHGAVHLTGEADGVNRSTRRRCSPTAPRESPDGWRATSRRDPAPPTPCAATRTVHARPSPTRSRARAFVTTTTREPPVPTSIPRTDFIASTRAVLLRSAAILIDNPMITLRAPLKLVLPVSAGGAPVRMDCRSPSLDRRLPSAPHRNRPRQPRRRSRIRPNRFRPARRASSVSAASVTAATPAAARSGPDLIRSTLVAEDVRGDKIGPVIRQGRPDKGMPGSNLSDADIAAIVAFIHDAKAKAEADRRRPPQLSLSKICRPATPKRDGDISTAQAAARRATRSPAILRRSARATRGSRCCSACSIPVQVEPPGQRPRGRPRRQ